MQVSRHPGHSWHTRMFWLLAFARQNLFFIQHPDKGFWPQDNYSQVSENLQLRLLGQTLLFTTFRIPFWCGHYQLSRKIKDSCLMMTTNTFLLFVEKFSKWFDSLPLMASLGGLRGNGSCNIFYSFVPVVLDCSKQNLTSGWFDMCRRVSFC